MSEGRARRSRSRRCAAILLLGPTGSGKTPLGELLDSSGLWGRRCLHFDFGAHLRMLAAGIGPIGLLSPEERSILDEVVRTGALLEDQHFPIARKILLDFLARRGAGPDSLVALNGLPRHLGQARAIEPILEIRALIHLRCEAEVAMERIRANAGGDRACRADDDVDGVRKRIDTFRQRTEPLLDHYRSLGVHMIELVVSPDAVPRDVLASLESAPAC